MVHPIKKMIEKRKEGIKCAMPSYCSANELVIEAIMEEAKRYEDIVLIEATANQVNQFGGYTGMQAADFAEYVYQIAKRVGLDKSRIVLGGDHLGPLTWSGETEKIAMGKAVDLVKMFIEAGFTKIHLDTSMKLGSDSPSEKLDIRKIAERGAALYLVCQEAYKKRKAQHSDAIKPVYVIGSEVPIPGGGHGKEEIEITSVSDFETTIKIYSEIFEEYGIHDAWDNIVAIVVQPGVEFSDANVCMYNRVKAYPLSQVIEKYKNIVFEGHSTDYQSAALLKEMVEDGVAILKVGPALTFSLREALFALHKIEKEILGRENSEFENVLEKTMLEKSENWEKHYHGNEKELYLSRKYSFSDRSRYYLGEDVVKNAIDTMLDNLDRVEIPLTLICQYMPVQYKRVRDGIIKNNARALAKDAVVNILYDYEYATKENYSIQYR